MSTSVPTPQAPKFWERQFAPTATEVQIGFDAVFGILFPAFCLLIDPIVFRDGMYGRSLAGDQALAGMLATICGMISLAAWLLLRKFPALFAGLLTGGAFFAAGLGVLILPMSILGLVVVIGVFGFTPFITAFVFMRNAIRAYERACLPNPRPTFLLAVLAGLILSCGGPLVAQSYVTHEVSRGMDLVLSANPGGRDEGIGVLKRFHRFANLDPLVQAYDGEQDRDRRAILAAAYRELTGEDIEHRLAILND